MSRTSAAAPSASSSMSEMARAMARASPLRTRSASGAETGTSGSQKLTGDHQPLDLAGTLADGGELDVAEVLLGRVVLDEPVAAEDLDRVLGGTDRDLGGIELGHRRLERHLPPLVLQPRGPIGEQPCGLDSGCVVEQLPADRLKPADLLSELCSIAGVGASGL